jgi:short-subunit dehydrogenase
MAFNGSKRALVTGGSSGLGKAICDQLLETGWHVISVDRQKKAGAKASQQFQGMLQHFQCDLSDRDAVDALLIKLSQQQPFDLMILNAGASATGKFEEIPLKVHEALVRLNAETPMILASFLAANGLMAQGSHLGIISSLSHFTGYPGASSYAASKDALAVYGKSIRKPFARLGITVSAVFPGPLQTHHAERHSPKNANVENRMKPEEAADLILRDILKGRTSIMPGSANKAIALASLIAPQVTARIMRQLIYKKLDRNVY